MGPHDVQDERLVVPGGQRELGFEGPELLRAALLKRSLAASSPVSPSAAAAGSFLSSSRQGIIPSSAWERSIRQLIHPPRVKTEDFEKHAGMSAIDLALALPFVRADSTQDKTGDPGLRALLKQVPGATPQTRGDQKGGSEHRSSPSLDLFDISLVCP